MDPTANLSEQLRLSTSLRREMEAGRKPNINDVERLCDLVEALDGWLKQGNFLPRQWDRKKGG
jgi:hypothetical protein